MRSDAAGSAGIIGTDAVAKSPPDGYTMGLVTSTFAMTPTLQALTDLLGGHVSMLFPALPSAMPHLMNII